MNHLDVSGLVTRKEQDISVILWTSLLNKERIIKDF